MKAPTREDFFRVGAAEVLSRSQARQSGKRISRQAVFTEGTDINMILSASSVMADEAMRHHAQSMAALYFDSAEGEKLDRIIADRTSRQVVRHRETASQVTLRFSRSIPSGTPLTFQPGRRFRADGIEFSLGQSVSFPAGFVGSVDGVATAAVTGSRTNVDSNRIRTFVVPSEDPNITVTNPSFASGGDEEEQDPAFRQRASRWFLAQIRGSIQAIEFGALSVSGIRSAVLFEAMDSSGKPTGDLELAIADANGRANKILVDRVIAELRNWRGAGVWVTVFGGTPIYNPIEYSLRFRPGVNTSAVAEQVKVMTVAAVNLLAPGEPLTRAQLLSIARSVYGTIVDDNSVIVPAGTIGAAPGAVLKTRMDMVKVNGL